MTRNVLVIGAGVVGQATGKGLSVKGYNVTFSDINPIIIGQLRKEGYKAFIPDDLEILDFDIFMLSVPTYPLKELKSTKDTSTDGNDLPQRYKDGADYIRSASATVGKLLSKSDRYGLVVIRSTVLPGTTEQVLIPILEEQSGKKARHDFGVCVNPEYLRERSAEADFKNPWTVVIGELDERSGDLLQETYQWVSCTIHRVTIREAEMQKFVHNLCNAAKISFFNEIRQICWQVGVDPDIVFPIVTKSAESFWNPAYGTRNFGPFGGTCLVKDLVAFLSWAEDQGMESAIVKAVLKVNQDFEKAISNGKQNY